MKRRGLIISTLALVPWAVEAKKKKKKKRGDENPPPPPPPPPISSKVYHVDIHDYTAEYQPFVQEAAGYMNDRLGQFGIVATYTQHSPLDPAACGALPKTGVVNVCEDYRVVNNRIVASFGGTGNWFQDDPLNYHTEGQVTFFYHPYKPDGTLSGYTPTNTARHELGHSVRMSHTGECSCMTSYSPNCNTYTDVNIQDMVGKLA